MGAKPGGMKGNKQRAEYEEPGKKTRETRLERTGKSKEAERPKGGIRKAAVRRSGEEKERKKQKAE